jgi:hypothetical protein
MRVFYPKEERRDARSARVSCASAVFRKPAHIRARGGVTGGPGFPVDPSRVPDHRKRSPAPHRQRDEPRGQASRSTPKPDGEKGCTLGSALSASRKPARPGRRSRTPPSPETLWAASGRETSYVFYEPDQPKPGDTRSHSRTRMSEGTPSGPTTARRSGPSTTGSPAPSPTKVPDKTAISRRPAPRPHLRERLAVRGSGFLSCAAGSVRRRRARR